MTRAVELTAICVLVGVIFAVTGVIQARTQMAQEKVCKAKGGRLVLAQSKYLCLKGEVVDLSQN